MAKKKLKPIVHRQKTPKEKKLGLIKKKKAVSATSFRLGDVDLHNLKTIRAKMDSRAQQKVISMSDVIKALIRHGLKVDSSLLIKALGENL